MKQPPKKLSALLELALGDLAKVEKSKKYVVDMGEWHSPRYNETCYVCLAGAVMAKTFNLPLTACGWSIEYSAKWNAAFHAINYARAGYLSTAFMHMDLNAVLPDRGICDYAINRTQFKRDMRRLIADLRKVGA